MKNKYRLAHNPYVFDQMCALGFLHSHTFSFHSFGAGVSGLDSHTFAFHSFWSRVSGLDGGSWQQTVEVGNIFIHI